MSCPAFAALFPPPGFTTSSWQTDETNAYEKAKAKACETLVAGNREGDNNFAMLTDHPNTLFLL
jgi:hypothetical protein